MAVCPLYRHTRREEMVARGKLALFAADLERPAGEPLPTFHRHAIDHCLLCHSCEANCPKGVKITDLVIAAREEIAREAGLPPGKRLFFALLGGKIPGLARMLKFGALFQGLAWRRIPQSSGLRRRLPFPLTDDHTVIPRLPRRQLADFLRARKPADSGPPVIFFPGCAISYLFPEIGRATIRVLERLGFTVLVPKFVCCGTAARAAGDRNTADNLQHQNHELLAALPLGAPVITACATCGHALMRYDLGGRRAVDISVFLMEHRARLETLLAGRTLDLDVTCHDPCHLRKGQGVIREPRELLDLITGNRFRDLAHPELCCGSGGTFGVTHRELSRTIQAEKIAEITATGATVAASGCPGCLIQLREGLTNAGTAITAEHPVVLLDRLLG
ncbi:MAG: (Fe-S)-binding protein [Deltaproteobacteria bacterium]|nr:(Fe-S)-binding protein [Candidatus Anaeroferrophillacea bacterium]